MNTNMENIGTLAKNLKNILPNKKKLTMKMIKKKPMNLLNTEAINKLKGIKLKKKKIKLKV